MTYMTKFKILALSAALSSCSGLPLYDYGYNAIKESYLSLDNQVLDENYMTSSKYAFIRVRFGASRSSLLALVRESNNILEWISADSIKIYTLNGKIIKTSGLPNDVEILSYPDFFSFVGSDFSTSYITNFYDPKLLEQLTRSDLSRKGKKNINSPIVGRDKLRVDLIEEKIYIESINWSRKNKYFFNANKEIEKTIQYTHPFSRPITIEFVKKYKKS